MARQNFHSPRQFNLVFDFFPLCIACEIISGKLDRFNLSRTSTSDRIWVRSAKFDNLSSTQLFWETTSGKMDSVKESGTVAGSSLNGRDLSRTVQACCRADSGYGDTSLNLFLPLLLSYNVKQIIASKFFKSTSVSYNLWNYETGMPRLTVNGERLWQINTKFNRLLQA